MFLSHKKTSYILDAFTKAKTWIKNNTLAGGIIHSSSLRKPYPEVTGYYIPSLLKWGEKDLACLYGDWLLSIQTPEGAWQELGLKTIYTFDTGQILKGLHDLIPFSERYEKSFLQGCNWLLSQIDAAGRIHTPTMTHFSNIGNEYIHLYTLEPLKLAALKYDRLDYQEGVARALNYYLQQPNLTDFNILSHFHAYIIEALIDLGHQEHAIEGLTKIKKHQHSNGSIPAFPKAHWTCLTALFQYAVCYYKLGLLNEGNKLLEYAISKQNPSGGFYGGVGWYVNYFKKIEISWPVKYLLDAIYLKLQLEKKDGSAIQKGYTDCNDYYVDHYLSSHKDTPNRKYKIDYLPELIMDSLSLSDNHSILYVGCGTGGFTRILNKTAKFVGIDYSPKMISAAEMLLTTSHSKYYKQRFCGKFADKNL